jgi:uncharacterized membrane protein YccC
MAQSSVSFRISRSAEDLAETIHALSQRLVALERRMSAMELHMAEGVEETDPEQEIRLENVEKLLQDCRDLLATDPAATANEVLQGNGGLNGIAEQETNMSLRRKTGDSPPEAQRNGPRARVLMMSKW